MKGLALRKEAAAEKAATKARNRTTFRCAARFISSSGAAPLLARAPFQRITQESWFWFRKSLTIAASWFAAEKTAALGEGRAACEKKPQVL